MDVIQILEDLITIYDRVNNKKRSNDEINMIIKATNKEIATVKEFLLSFSWKPSS